MSTDRLPLEVYRRIIGHLQPIPDSTALAALAQTSKALQPLAERTLYHTLFLPGVPPLARALATLTARPALAAHIRHIFLQPSSTRLSPRAYWLDAAALLAAAAPRAELLCIAAPDADAAWALHALRAAPHLAELRVPFWWGAELAASLPRALARLETGDAHGAPPVLPPGAAPRLRVVEGPAAALGALVPGRPVTHVRLRAGAGALPPAAHLLGESLVRSAARGGVVALDTGDLAHAQPGETYSLEVLELAPRFVPHLRFLGRVTFPSGKDAEHLPSRMYRPLIRLAELETLELVVGHLHPATDVYWELATASELRAFCASLRQVVFFQNATDVRRWVWDAAEGDFVLASHNERYLPWGGVL